MLTSQRCGSYINPDPRRSSSLGDANMKGLGIWLLTLALSWDLGWSLQCYLCPYAVPSNECTDTKNCTAAQTACKTNVVSGFEGYPFQGNEMVIRDCASVCDPSDNDQIGDDTIIFCCFSDLCNNRGLYASGSSGGESSMKNTYGLLICLISLIITLFRTEL